MRLARFELDKEKVSIPAKVALIMPETHLWPPSYYTTVAPSPPSTVHPSLPLHLTGLLNPIEQESSNCRKEVGESGTRVE